MLVDQDLEQVVLQDLQYEVKIRLVAVDDQFLDQIIAKRVDNQLIEIRVDLGKDNFEVVESGLVVRNQVLVYFLL